MDDFEKKAHNGVCDICGKNGCVITCNSALGAFSLSYCEGCYDNNIMPYDSLVVSLAYFPIDYVKNANDTVKEIIANTLKFNNKTMQEFIKDLEKQKDFIEEFEDFVNY